MKNTIIILFLTSISLIGISQTKINYVKLFEIDSTQCNDEMFFYLLRDHYSPFGEIEEMTVVGEGKFDVDKMCFRFIHRPFRWVCYTPVEAENELYKILNK
jgi:hypothetical protein